MERLNHRMINIERGIRKEIIFEEILGHVSVEKEELKIKKKIITKTAT